MCLPKKPKIPEVPKVEAPVPVEREEVADLADGAGKTEAGRKKRKGTNALVIPLTGVSRAQGNGLNV